jgi:hypothetical protein
MLGQLGQPGIYLRYFLGNQESSSLASWPERKL